CTARATICPQTTKATATRCSDGLLCSPVEVPPSGAAVSRPTFAGIGSRAWPLTEPPRPAVLPGLVGEDEVERAPGLVDLLDGCRALLLGGRAPELVHDAHQLADALVQRGVALAAAGA